MGEPKSLEELKRLASTHSTDSLKKLVESDPNVAKQLKFEMPNTLFMHGKDLDGLDKDDDCMLWGLDPETGEWICLKRKGSETG